MLAEPQFVPLLLHIMVILQEGHFRFENGDNIGSRCAKPARSGIVKSASPYAMHVPGYLRRQSMLRKHISFLLAVWYARLHAHPHAIHILQIRY